MRRQQRLREDLPALILWVLEGTGHKDMPYPFALPHWDFYRRCLQFEQQAQRWLPPPRSAAERHVLKQAATVLAALGRAGRIAWAVPRLERRWAVFNQLRAVLRLRDDELPRGVRRAPFARRCPASAAQRLQTIETAAKAYPMFVSPINMSFIISRFQIRNSASGTTFREFLRKLAIYTIVLRTPPGDRDTPSAS